MANYPQTTTTQFTGTITLTDGGNVGIGTTNPAEDLTVKGQSAALRLEDENGTVAARLLVNPSDDDGRLMLYDGGSLKVDLQANGSSYFDGGDVGIGTTSPESRLHLAESGDNTILQVDTYYSGNKRPVIQLKRSDSSTLGGKDSTESGDDIGFVEFYGVNGSIDWAKTATIEVEQYGNAGATYIPGIFRIKTGPNSSGPISRLCITPDGNVGMGVDPSPTEKLDVDGNIKGDALVISGSSAPSTTQKGMLWYDSANDVLKIRNIADTGWNTVFTNS